jgi:hypothetical protein
MVFSSGIGGDCSAFAPSNLMYAADSLAGPPPLV